MNRQSGLEHLVVDGYNLIKAWPRLRRHERSSLELARQSLIRVLGEYAQRTGAQVELYFDGDDGIDQPAVRDCSRVHVVFARPPHKADDLIAEFVQHKHGSKRVWVISSDREVRGAARRHRIRSSTSDEFVRQLERPAPPPDRPVAPPAPDAELDEEQLAAWERVFREERGMFADEDGD